MLPWHTTGIYDHPEDFGLTLTSEARELLGPGHCEGYWKIFGVWRTEDNRRLIGFDEGCNCKEPFENTHPSDLLEVTDAEFWTFVESHTDDPKRVDKIMHTLSRG